MVTVGCPAAAELWSPGGGGWSNDIEKAGRLYPLLLLYLAGTADSLFLRVLLLSQLLYHICYQAFQRFLCEIKRFLSFKNFNIRT